ncbi:N-alpha-acetyltransferase 30 isoform X2 [Dryobates pubescens]|uniref:N-alpha-acetyltransferase 30 isoform X2 n=1 Tax=Dryobates pubescens TaxID=118200 RepID=UPI0023B8BD0F|nr:N-alpha-acetyltransferase 30 isoform X2 [Dryobates pubescens]
MAEVPPGPSGVLSPQGDTLSPFPGGGGGAASSSSTSSAAAAACTGAQDEEAEEEEEEEGPTGGREQQRGGGSSDGGKGGQQQQHRLHHHHHHSPHHNHQLNGLISPELRHLRASLKSKILSSEAGAAPEGLENKRASKTMGSGQQQQSSPPTTTPCSSPLNNHLPPQGRTAPSPPPSPPAAEAAKGDRSQPAATTTTAAKTAARNGLAGGTGLEEEEQEEGDEGGEEEESLLLLSRSLEAACSLKGSGTDSQPEEDLTIRYVRYESELQMPDIMRLITKDLSEPYSIYTYRYFIHNWPQLCFLVVLETEITNKSALKLYENLGFVRDKRLFRYYLNGVDALRLKLWLR